VLESRPLPKLKEGKRRRIPILTQASGLPFLRVGKPQSPFLSRVLRNKLQQKQKRYDRMSRAEDAIAVGEREEEWEEIVEEQLSGRRVERRGGGDGERERKRERDWDGVWKKGEELWGAREKTERYKIMESVILDAKQSKMVGDKMLEIVDKEKELRAKEDKERRLEKMRKKRELKKAEADRTASF
jgi:hypothetical protein